MAELAKVAISPGSTGKVDPLWQNPPMNLPWNSHEILMFEWPKKPRDGGAPVRER